MISSPATQSHDELLTHQFDTPDTACTRATTGACVHGIQLMIHYTINLESNMNLNLNCPVCEVRLATTSYDGRPCCHACAANQLAGRESEYPECSGCGRRAMSGGTLCHSCSDGMRGRGWLGGLPDRLARVAPWLGPVMQEDVVSIEVVGLDTVLTIEGRLPHRMMWQPDGEGGEGDTVFLDDPRVELGRLSMTENGVTVQFVLRVDEDIVFRYNPGLSSLTMSLKYLDDRWDTSPVHTRSVRALRKHVDTVKARIAAGEFDRVSWAGEAGKAIDARLKSLGL